MTHKDILTPNTPSLGFGAMRLPDMEQTTQMVDTYMASGYNYFDTAYAYGGSEELLKNTLVKRHPRHSYMVANKLPHWELKTPEDNIKILEESLRRCGMDYFDFYLMHCTTRDTLPMFEQFGALRVPARAAEEGQAALSGLFAP